MMGLHSICFRFSSCLKADQALHWQQIPFIAMHARHHVFRALSATYITMLHGHMQIGLGVLQCKSLWLNTQPSWQRKTLGRHHILHTILGYD